MPTDYNVLRVREGVAIADIERSLLPGSFGVLLQYRSEITSVIDPDGRDLGSSPTEAGPSTDELLLRLTEEEFAVLAATQCSGSLGSWEQLSSLEGVWQQASFSWPRVELLDQPVSLSLYRWSQRDIFGLDGL